MRTVLVIAASPHGYGHFLRGNLICEYLSQSGLDVVYLTNITNGSPIVTYQPHVEIDIDMDSGTISKESRRRMAVLLKERAFDDVIFDHFPLGKLSLTTLFDIIERYAVNSPRYICVFRDLFVDIAPIIPRCVDFLNHHFDQLLVFSDPKYLNLPLSLSDTITIPIDYLGYLDPNPPKQLLVFGGGGKYNYEFYKQTLEVIGSLGLEKQYEVKLISGTALSENEFCDLKGRFGHVCVEWFSPALEDEISKSAITISSLGYNTFVQLVKYNNDNIIVPMLRNEEEQNDRGKLLEHFKPNHCSLISFSEQYKALLCDELKAIVKKQLNNDGLWNLKNMLNQE